jgi:SAM-dependent methyltransferase
MTKKWLYEGSSNLESSISEIRSRVETIESNEALYEDTNFRDRVGALDFLEFDVLDRVEGLLLTDDQHTELIDLRQYATTVKTRLEVVDERLFQRLRDNVASQNYTGAELKRLLIEYAGSDPSEGDEGYDGLDALVNGLLLRGTAPEETREWEPEMVFYQPTPTRTVLELIEKASFRPNDVFYDIGSGLGQVSILVHLLSRVRAKGVEFEPAHCDYARQCAQALNLSQVEFINVDAREADYTDGTVFFLYTPFEGKMLEQVLRKLRDESRTREIRLYTYGPCTLQVTQQRWLERVDHNGRQVYRLAIFKTSRKESKSEGCSNTPHRI